jgi:hypothetical protein
MPQALSAMYSLLCMRCWMRRSSCTEASARSTPAPRAPGSGLNMRISTPGTKAMPITRALAPVLLKSSSRMRTRTPRAAAARTSRSSSRVLASAWMA